MSSDGLAALRARAYADDDLAGRLRRIEPERFVDGVVRIGAELGLCVSEPDLRQAIAHGRQEWSLRWIM